MIFEKEKPYEKKLLAAILALGMVFSMLSMTLELEPNQKLEMITWKDDSLWYLTRPMTESDTAETHTFQQSSEFGVFEGTITIVESKTEPGGEK